MYNTHIKTITHILAIDIQLASKDIPKGELWFGYIIPRLNDLLPIGSSFWIRILSGLCSIFKSLWDIDNCSGLSSAEVSKDYGILLHPMQIHPLIFLS